MSFVKKEFGLADEFLEPVLPTPAIEAMTRALRKLLGGFSGPDKPKVVTCFDTSGSGKTTTVTESAKNLNAIVVSISPFFTDLLRNTLQSCSAVQRELGFSGDDLVKKSVLEQRFYQEFCLALDAIFHEIALRLSKNKDSAFTMAIEVQPLPFLSHPGPDTSIATKVCRGIQSSRENSHRSSPHYSC